MFIKPEDRPSRPLFYCCRFRHIKESPHTSYFPIDPLIPANKGRFIGLIGKFANNTDTMDDRWSPILAIFFCMYCEYNSSSNSRGYMTLHCTVSRFLDACHMARAFAGAAFKVHFFSCSFIMHKGTYGEAPRAPREWNYSN